MKVSVVVPVRDEEQSLPTLLESLLDQSHSPDEILLADGGSRDGTVACARRYAGRGVRVMEIGPAYPGRGRNEGIKAARNPWIALIDAGCVPERQWIEALVSTLPKDRKACVVFGQLVPRLQSEWDVAQALSLVSPVDLRSGCRAPVIVSCLLHRSVWETVGGFPEHLRAAEDLVFLRRIHEAGISTDRSPQAVVYWTLAEGPRAVFKRLRLYSAHHLSAGLSHTWHRRVFIMDAIAVFLLAAAAFWPLAMALLAMGAIGRVLRTIGRRKANVMDGQAFRYDRVARVAVLLLLADLAAWAGAADFIWRREAVR